MSDANVGDGKSEPGEPGAAASQTLLTAERLERLAEEVVSRHPASALLVAFGVGLGLGLVLNHRREPTAPPARLPDSLRELSDRIADQLAEHLSKWGGSA